MPLWSSMLSHVTHEATMIFSQSERFSMSSSSSRPSQYRYMPGSRRALSLYISQRKPSRLSPAVVIPTVSGFQRTFWPLTPASQTFESG